MNSTLFLSLVLAHIIGDFYLQTDKYCQQKETRKFKSWFLYVHAIIIGVLSWMIVPSCNFGLWAFNLVSSLVYETCQYPHKADIGKISSW